MSRWYFQPRPFELHNNGIIYVRLGVRIYKKYVPSSGDLVTRLQGKKRLKIVETGDRREALENYERQTRIWERRHLISAVLLQSWAVFGGIVYGSEQFWVSSAINLVVNLYPIMLQRYNRVRITRILEKMNS